MFGKIVLSDSPPAEQLLDSWHNTLGHLECISWIMHVNAHSRQVGYLSVATLFRDLHAKNRSSAQHKLLPACSTSNREAIVRLSLLKFKQLPSFLPVNVSTNNYKCSVLYTFTLTARLYSCRENSTLFSFWFSFILWTVPHRRPGSVLMPPRTQENLSTFAPSQPVASSRRNLS